MTLKALLVEDNLDILNLIKLQVESLNIEATCCSDGNKAISLIEQNKFDLFLLDRMIPGRSGIELCKYIRCQKKIFKSPILLVTALTLPEQIIEGLDAGADDYITKPFDLNILLARIRCQVRRVELLDKHDEEIKSLEFNKNNKKLCFGAFVLEFSSRMFYLENIHISLTKSEFELLDCLMRNIGRVLSRKELISKIQGGDIFVTDRTIDTHIFGLRKKLNHYAAQIESVRGIGYRLNEKL